MASASLGRRMQLWLLGYVALSTVVLFVAVYYVHERAEHGVWAALLNTELDSIIDRLGNEPGFHWQDSDTLRLFRSADGLPAQLQAFPPGLHDNLIVQGRPSVMLVRDAGSLGRMALVLDITDFDALERFVTRWSIIAGIALILVTLLMASLGIGGLVRPLSRLASDIGALKPESVHQRIDVDPRGSSELFVIARSLNDYLARHDRFVERERMFIDTASHELRTPMAVIVGATELALNQSGLPEAARAQVLRAHRSARSVEQLISLLLVLAKDPGRLSRNSDRIELDELVREIVSDHHYLTDGKDLAVNVDELAHCEVMAPIGIVQAAIGNLLRNAIENSDQGEIRVRVSADATVTIEDPGHGMTPEEVSRIYAQIARGGSRDGGGIGLDLLGRLCEHLGWRLRIDSEPGRGTTSVLELRGNAG